MTDDNHPEARWYLLDFASDAQAGPVVPMRWRGDEGPRPVLIPFKPGTRELSTLFGAELDEQIDRLAAENAPRLRALWTDRGRADFDYIDGNVIITWRAGQPSSKELAVLRRLHPPFASESLAELRARMSRGTHFSFDIDASDAGAAESMLSSLTDAGIVAVVTKQTGWEMAWPPAHVAVEHFAGMWQSPEAWVLVEDEQGRLDISPADKRYAMILDEGSDLLRELKRRMREAGVRVVRSSDWLR